MELEICANSFKSAQAAVQGGADRIELCTELQLGGITPSAGLLSLVLEHLEIPTHVLIRPKGGEFVYSYSEVEVMVRDIHWAKKAGAHGVVVGALTIKNELDLDALTQFAKAAQGIDYSMHKAFDALNQPELAIPVLANLGFKRILTSGGRLTAQEGLDNLIRWNYKFGDIIQIMPGGSIRPNNIQEFTSGNFLSVHSAAIPQGEQQTSMQVVAQLKAAMSP